MPFNDAYSIDFEHMATTPPPFANFQFEMTATTAATAPVLKAFFSVITNAVTGASYTLPVVTSSSQQFTILNRSSAEVLVVPSPGWSIETLPPNAPVGIMPNGKATFTARNPALKLPPLWYAH